MLKILKFSSFRKMNALSFLNSHTPKYFFRLSLKKDDVTKLDNVSERKNRKDNLYVPKQTLIFEQGKIPLINTKDSTYLRSLLKQRYLLISASIFTTGVCIISAVVYSNYILCAVNGALVLCFLYFTRNLNINLSRIVTGFNLLEDGKFVEIHTVSKKFKVGIKLLAKPNKIQAQALRTLNPELANLTTPFIVDKGEHKGFYYVAPDAFYENKEEIISAIMNNSYIDVSPEKIIDSKKKVFEKN